MSVTFGAWDKSSRTYFSNSELNAVGDDLNPRNLPAHLDVWKFRALLLVTGAPEIVILLTSISELSCCEKERAPELRSRRSADRQSPAC